LRIMGDATCVRNKTSRPAVDKIEVSSTLGPCVTIAAFTLISYLTVAI
jgi:hypothetical protein